MPEEKVALVTAAGRGMGAAIARELAASGYKVALLSPSERSVELAGEIGGLGIRGSVTEPADLEALVEAALKTYGRIDAVVNNTGHPPKGELVDITDDSWRQGLDMLVLNVARIMRLVTPVMLKQGGGSIVNISSIVAVAPELSMPISSVLRAALSSWTRLYAERYAKDNIRMNSILPGFIDSYASAPSWIEKVPAGRFGKTTEIAKAVKFLLSDDASFITGQNIRVDGGFVRGL
jgi:NAD(P)-dependent dehydrogenase (short-subunit alcohol dehydrogenase family)